MCVSTADAQRSDSAATVPAGHSANGRNKDRTMKMGLRAGQLELDHDLVLYGEQAIEYGVGPNAKVRLAQHKGASYGDVIG